MNTKVVGITFASTMLFATITSGLLLSSSSTHATDDSAVTVTEITVPSSCSMTANVSTPHVADIVNGNRAINIGKTTLSTFCNDPGGFAIYAIGYTNNELGSTNVIASNNTDTIATGNTAPSNNSSWGMKVVNSSSSQFPATITSYFNVATNDGYVAVPSTFTLMASRNSGTAMDSATLLDTTYGAYISTTQPVGEYNGQVLYTMVHPSSAAGPNAETMFEAAFLMQPTPPTKKTVGSNSYYKMQDMTPDICTVMSIGAEGQMVDDRDDKIYWVLKAKDGKCWMTQNLDHDIVTTANFYTPQNTDIDTNWTAINATTSTIDSNGNFTGWTDSATVPYSADPGDWYFTDTYYNSGCETSPNYCDYLNGNANNKFATTPYLANGTHGHVGNYYNWTAAVALNDSSAYPIDSNTTSPYTSICPAGWRLPSSRNDEYLTLLNAYNAYIETGNELDRAMLASPLYLTRTGALAGGSLNVFTGAHGYLWSGDTSSSGYAFRLVFAADLSTPSYATGNRIRGQSVRCLARTGTEPKTVNRAFKDAGKTTVSVSGTNYYKMQDMNSTICGKITKGQTGKLVDARDDTVYNIGKLEDDRCWLLDNLAIDLVSVSLATLKGNTNASDTALEYLKGTRTGTTSDQYATAAVANGSNSNSSVPFQLTTSINVLPTTDRNDTNEPMASQVTAGQWKVGVYYNYCAASAGTYCYGSSAGSGNATADICPSGWRMPTGGSSGEYQALATVINGTTGDITDSTKYTNFRATLRLPLSGYVNGVASGQGTNGNFWSSTYYNSNFMHLIRVETSSILPQNTGPRYLHLSVRCIAK